MPKKVITLTGNPNVGKSTVFNSLTGLNQHTGNWAGKTVMNAKGKLNINNETYTLMDIPGIYSLSSNSKDEEIARNFLCFRDVDKIVVVCDATNLERNFLLLLQVIEMKKNVVLCINLKDEAINKKIDVNISKLEEILGIDVVYISARTSSGINQLTNIIGKTCDNKNMYQFQYNEHIEYALNILEKELLDIDTKSLAPRWIALKLLENDIDMIEKIINYLNIHNFSDRLFQKISEVNLYLSQNGIGQNEISSTIIKTVYKNVENILSKCVKYRDKNYHKTHDKVDKLLTSKLTGIPIMLLLLMFIFWITIAGANVPSSILSNILSIVGEELKINFIELKIPDILINIMIDGIYNVVSFVVSVMLPPMAIFFPLFSILEDLGYLPRVAFNTDRIFKGSGACGKQCLTMAMGFGCNACGVVGCRIINSRKERLIAILTNNFVPCNGRFPMIIAVISMFFVGDSIGFNKSFYSALFLTLIILIGIIATLVISKILSKTILKGEQSSYTLELPPYRKPKIVKTIIRSIFDKTLLILGRAVVVSIPAGVIVWMMGNVIINDKSILMYVIDSLEPFGTFMGLDGVILMGFIVGIPANEIVLPLILMGYLESNSLIETENLVLLKDIFILNGWTIKTAICMVLFSLFHWPCSTTLITIQKETGSTKWAIVSFIIPTIVGIIVCSLVNFLF